MIYDWKLFGPRLEQPTERDKERAKIVEQRKSKLHLRNTFCVAHDAEANNNSFYSCLRFLW